MTTDNLRIESYDTADFAFKIQQATLDGYRLNLEDNDKYPIQVGIGFYCTMEKVEEKEVTEQPIVTKGRPPKK